MLPIQKDEKANRFCTHSPWLHYSPEACLSWFPLTFIGHQAARHGINPVKGIMRSVLPRTFNNEIGTIAHMETEAPTNWDLPQVPQDRDRREMCLMPPLLVNTVLQPSWKADVMREGASILSKKFLSNHLSYPQRHKDSIRNGQFLFTGGDKPRLDDLWSELWRRKFIYWVDYLTWWDLKIFQL